MRRGFRLLLMVLAPIAVFAAMVAADRLFAPNPQRPDYVVRIELPAAGGTIGLPAILGPPDASRPLVLIDPGHGGKDPGASAGALEEKTLTLSLARALRDALLKQGGIRVALTRSDDRYLFLDERLAIAHAMHPDVFISIHADAADTPDASGATVYTLSDKGSDQVAERLAARENAADTVNGVRIAGRSDTVNAILVDLSQRETHTQSQELANLILREGDGRIPFRDRSQQSAAFVVLKSPDIPSVLFETGYISNPGDAARLASASGRDAFADVTARAVRVFLARRLAQ